MAVQPKGETPLKQYNGNLNCKLYIYIGCVLLAEGNYSGRNKNCLVTQKYYSSL